MIHTITRRFIKKHERGQSIIVLAFGFVALLMFVGIVTDISLMFVRYSTLRRAVDSAAIAAAGQMRQDRNFANVQLAARQFIEFHGLNPETVLVETCQTAYTPEDQTELCTTQQRKLVRVTAQINSPTVFLRLLGWGNIVLEASAISETATLDVVIVLDVSESMLEDTTYEHWAEIGMGYVYAPPTVWDFVKTRDGGTATQTTWALTWEQLTADAQQYGDPMDYDYNVPPGTNPVIDRYRLPDGRELPDLLVRGVWPGASPTMEPRVECRVRFWSNSTNTSVDTALPTNPPTNMLNFFRDMPGAGSTDWRNRQRPFPSFYDGWVPTYDFYGCCNDPGTMIDGVMTSNFADFNFNDLVCQPFRSARDATLEFLQTIDFARGDRVAFVTFDQQAFLIDPDGDEGKLDNNGVLVDFSTMIDERTAAEYTLINDIGVRTEPTYYAWDQTTDDDEGNGGWYSFVAPRSDGTIGPVNARFTDAPNNYPVRNDCVFYNAALAWPYSPYTNRNNQPTSLDPIFYRYVPGANPARLVMTPGDPAFRNPINGQRPKTIDQYTFRGACRGTNVGAALREANNALTRPETIRETNTVWVIVFLGDGAAGASDPVVRNGVAAGVYGNPYQNEGLNPIPTDYGVYGVCPYGTVANPGELVENDGFPFCSDEDPTSRHFCPFVEITCPDDPTSICRTVDLAAPGCDPDYDVDDYARDWADYVGLEENADSGVLLPTIFTIGFGLEFRAGSGSCEDNIPDCLGEELLRYIADVGDNYQIDIDYQQAYLAIRDGQTVNYGPRGICEDPLGLPGEIAPLPPRQNCGNYYNAPDAAELQLVFDDIASRMFTRIAR